MIARLEEVLDDNRSPITCNRTDTATALTAKEELEAGSGWPVTLRAPSA